MIALNHLEKMALRIVKDEEGQKWKYRLRIMWEKANYPGYEKYQDTLQHLRNCSYFGPVGLIKLRDEDLE
jgi:hypothetical protein